MRTRFRGGRGWEENAVLIYPSPPAKVSLRAKLKGVLVSKDRGVSFFSHLILDSPGRKEGGGEHYFLTDTPSGSRQQTVWSLYVYGRLPTYPSPKPTSALTSHLGQMLVRGRVGGQFPQTYNNPSLIVPVREIEVICRKSRKSHTL